MIKLFRKKKYFIKRRGNHKNHFYRLIHVEGDLIAKEQLIVDRKIVSEKEVDVKYRNGWCSYDSIDEYAQYNGYSKIKKKEFKINS